MLRSALPSASPTASTAPPGEILIVDDDEIARKVLGRFFESFGFTVTTAQSSIEALSCLSAGRRFQAVITDFVMPENTGVDLLHELRKLGHRELPVIILTGHPTLDSVISAIGDARVRYLLKTEAHDKLLTTVQELTRPPSHASGIRPSVVPQPVGPSRDRSPEVPSGSESPAPSTERPSGTHPSRRLGAEEHRHFDCALQNLWIAFQPIVSSRNEALFGYEALVRSRDEVLSTPELLFEAAERLDRTWDLGRRIRHLVAKRVAQGPSEGRIFVNLHSAELNDPELHASDAPLSAHAERVVLEVTERASLGAVPELKERLRHLREVGFSIALDDLGAGYAGLSSFSLLDPEVVKLDVSLVRNIDSHVRVQRLVGSLLQACGGDMGILVVCEGVETRAERDTLVALGADLLQGFLFGLPAYDFEKPKFCGGAQLP